MLPRESVTLVTGGTGVVGRHIANRIAQRGGHVVLAVRDTGKGERLAEELRRRHPCNPSVIEVDLASVESTVRLARTLEAKHGRLHSFVHAAAVTTPPKTREVTADGFEVTFQTNALSSFVLTTQLAPLLRKAKRSRVVNIASSTGLPILMGLPGHPNGLLVPERHGPPPCPQRRQPAPPFGADGKPTATPAALDGPDRDPLEEWLKRHARDLLLPGQDGASAEEGEKLHVMWPVVQGELDLEALTGELRPPDYNPNDALIQSKLALRQLSWAAASRFADMSENVSVHVCQLGEIALSPVLAQLGLEDGLLTPAQAATVPAFLACDKRLEGCGSGPFYWNSKLRIRQCPFMSQPETCDRVWTLCESLARISFPLEDARSDAPSSSSSPPSSSK